MNKTYRINLGGLPFEIDDNAFALLKEYLDTLRAAFSGAHYDDDLIDDIEARIAEIFAAQTATGSPIVSIAMVEDVIARIGKPEELIESEASQADAPAVGAATSATDTATPPPYLTPPPRIVRHRLYRDPRTKMIGGVCSGIAAYFDIDVTWVRLSCVALFFLSGTTVAILYLVMLIAVPEASTPMQYMELRGESPTLSAIGKSVTDAYFKVRDGLDSPGGSGSNRFLSGVVKVSAALMKGLLWIVSILGVPALIYLTCVFFLSLFTFFFNPPAIQDFWYFNHCWMFGYTEIERPRFALMAIIGATLLAAVPLLAVETAMFNMIGKRPLFSRATGTLLFGLLIAGALLFGIFRHLA